MTPAPFPRTIDVLVALRPVRQSAVGHIARSLIYKLRLTHELLVPGHGALAALVERLDTDKQWRCQRQQSPVGMREVAAWTMRDDARVDP